MSLSEEELSEALSGVLLHDDVDVDGIDEDLVAYMAGLISSQADEGNPITKELLEESLVPFLESVSCPSDLVESTKSAILEKAANQQQSNGGGASSLAEAGQSSSTPGGAQKLKQGIVSMSSALTDSTVGQDDEFNSIWGGGGKIKANANTQIDAYNDKTSAKDRRKAKQELEKMRRDLAAQNENSEQQDATKSGVSQMLLPTVRSKEKDVQLQGITLSLNNGTSLLEHGDLKFTYQRRYGLIGENGVGKLL